MRWAFVGWRRRNTLACPQTVYCGVREKKKGWPRYALAAFRLLVRHVSAIVRHVSALAAPPNLVRLLCLSHVCPPCVRSLSAMCLLFASSGPTLCVLASGLCPLVASCGAGPWHHKVKRKPRRLLYCMPTGQFPWHLLGLHKFRPLPVEKLFGVYAGIILLLISLCTLRWSLLTF